MIKTKKDLVRILKLEKLNYKISFSKYIGSFFGFSEPGIIWRYQKRLRKWEYHLNNGHKIMCSLYKLKTTHLGYKYGFAMSPNVFDEGLKIMHLGSIIINGASKVGKNCMLHINTAMVATNGKSDSPILGDNCRLGIGCKLIGGIKLGNDVVIGAGAVVTKSFDENHITLGGVPAKIISRNAII